jgi:hypothetical protein
MLKMAKSLKLGFYRSIIVEPVGGLEPFQKGDLVVSNCAICLFKTVIPKRVAKA